MKHTTNPLPPSPFIASCKFIQDDTDEDDSTTWRYVMVRCTDVDPSLRLGNAWMAEDVVDRLMDDDVYGLFGIHNEFDADNIHLMVGRERRGDARIDIYILIGLMIPLQDAPHLQYHEFMSNAFDEALCHQDRVLGLNQHNFRFISDITEVKWSISLVSDMQDVHEVGEMADVVF